MRLEIINLRVHNKTNREQLATDLFDGLTRLIITLLLMNIPSGEKSGKVNTAAIESLSDVEQHVFKALQQWVELLTPTNKNRKQTRKSKKDNDLSEENLSKVAVQWIDSITTTLVELRSELQKTSEITL